MQGMPILPPPNFKDFVRPYELNELANKLNGIEVLSIDCFDTLLWRKTATPHDVFFAMQHHPAFKSRQISALFRQRAETQAMQMQFLNSSTLQISLRDIYLQINPNYSEEDIASLSQAEIETESHFCFGFIPVVNLIKKAKEKNIKIIIVSDTYFSKSQLQMLLNNNIPDDENWLSDIFCSIDYKVGKLNGLFEVVAKKLKVNPQKILHLGDNFAADYVSARTQGMQALHFVHQHERIQDLHRLQETTAMIFDPNIRVSQPHLQPFNALLSLEKFEELTAEAFIGYASLGPVIFTFAKYLLEEIAELKKSERNLKVSFLMRDAWLPFLAFEKLSENSVGQLVRISRFAAIAASFKTEENIKHYIATLGISGNYADIGRQLLLPEKVLEPLIKIAIKSDQPDAAFAKAVLKTETTRIIIKKSEAYRKKLLKYLSKTTGIKAGDTLLLVDLGYNATVQHLLAPLLAELEIKVVGRYLISLPTVHLEIHRKGLIDGSWCDIKCLHALTAYIAWFEQLCTANENSVIDYDEAGNPIYSDVTVGKVQHNQLAQIQSEALRFVSNAKQYFSLFNDNVNSHSLRNFAVSEISRMIFMPTEDELNCIRMFNFDMNLGTKDVLQLFDSQKGLTGLRRRGLFFMENPQQSRRINYPAELRSAGFELAMTYLVQNRFNLKITPKDILARSEKIAVVLHHHEQQNEVYVEAYATYDGYYSLCVPAGTAVTFLLGKQFQFIELEEIELIAMHDFVNQTETINKKMILSQFHFHQVKSLSGKLYQCLSQDAAISFKMMDSSVKQVVRMIFRPIVRLSEQITIPANDLV